MLSAIGTAAVALQTRAEGHDATAITVLAVVLAVAAVIAAIGWLFTRPTDLGTFSNVSRENEILGNSNQAGRDNTDNSRHAGRDYYENATFQQAPMKPPVFSVTPDGGSQRQEAYSQYWNVAFVDGERPEAFAWRFRTPYQPPPDWRAVEIEHIPRTPFSPAPQDVSGALLEDSDLGPDQVAFELRYFWQGKWHHERHVYEVTRRQTTNTSPTRTHVELAKKLLPITKWTEA